MAATAATALPRPAPSHARLGLVVAASAAAHLAVLLLIAPAGRPMQTAAASHPPLLIDITPRLLPAPRSPAEAEPTTAPTAATSLPPIAVRPPSAAAPPPPAEVPPLAVEPAPVRVASPGRVIPRSWRERCDLPAEGPVDEAALQDCERMIIAGAAPPASQVRGGGTDHEANFAAQGARRLARYEYLRAPQTPGGGANARPSDEPGSNFGMGGIRDSVVTVARTGAGGTEILPRD